MLFRQAQPTSILLFIFPRWGDMKSVLKKVRELTEKPYIDDPKLDQFIQKEFCNESIRQSEDHILYCLKTLNELHPSEKNNQAWLDYSKFIVKRRKSVQ